MEDTAPATTPRDPDRPEPGDAGRSPEGAAGNPPDIAEMNYQGPMRYRPALRDVSALAKQIAGARGGLLP